MNVRLRDGNLERLRARSHRLLLAHQACRTVLLLSDRLPLERVSTMGDPYASLSAAGPPHAHYRPE